MARVLPLAAAILWSGAVNAAPFTYEDLVGLVQSTHATSLEQLLPALPASFRSSYTLMNQSRSLQQASIAAPRVILFGDDARLTCAFNGDLTQVGGDTLECFQFRAEQSAFDFRQITFPTPANGQTAVAFSASNQSTDGKVACSSCHGADPRPNWDAYSNWPGAYGTDDDDMETGGQEGTNYAAFVQLRPGHPRYKNLIQDADPVAPYMGSGVDASRRPNLRFSDFVGRMNGWRTARLLAAKVRPWETWAFAAGSLSCTLTDAQVAQVAAAGRPALTIDPLSIFQKLGMAPTDWSTEISGDGNADDTYDHQSGYSYLAADTAMGVVMTRVAAGDQDFSGVVQKFAANLAVDHAGNDLPFFQALDALLPDPDRFSSSNDANVAALCPLVTQRLVTSYLQPPSRD